MSRIRDYIVKIDGEFDAAFALLKEARAHRRCLEQVNHNRSMNQIIELFKRVIVTKPLLSKMPNDEENELEDKPMSTVFGEVNL